MSSESARMNASDVESLIDTQLQYFDSNAQRSAFSKVRVTPQLGAERWQYGAESHACFVVAKNDRVQLVFCATGFGPSFPWSVQKLGETDLGMDSEWHAYLYESFMVSGMWSGPLPATFVHMGPGERTKT
jgi:hypothetical protein